MYDNLVKSFWAIQQTFWSYQRLADSQTNPHKMEDFARACIIAGRMDQTARILTKEYDDMSANNAAADAVQWCEETADAL